NPVFSLTAVATVDEGNNWINLSYGPLSLAKPDGVTPLGNYALLSTSPAINAVPTTAATYGDAPNHDFFNNPRKTPTDTAVDIGAVEFVAVGGAAVATISGGPLTFTNVATGTTSASQTLTLTNSGTASITGITLAFSSPRFSRPTGTAGGTCGATLTPTT